MTGSAVVVRFVLADCDPARAARTPASRVGADAPARSRVGMEIVETPTILLRQTNSEPEVCERG